MMHYLTEHWISRNLLKSIYLSPQGPVFSFERCVTENVVRWLT